MARVSDQQLANWTKPAFGNEEEQALNTERIIREAIKSHDLLKTLDIRVFAKGSFKNNTNVRRDSDVDVAVEYKGLITVFYPDGIDDAQTGLSNYSGPFEGTGRAAFKAAVHEALIRAFGSSAVDGSGNKVFVLKESSRSLAADVVPCTTHRHYFSASSYNEGIELILDQPDGKQHVNYPDQHYDNGVAKNSRTGKRYKSVVRILKNIENKLVEDDEIKEVPSFLIECLAYNVPDSVYNTYTPWRSIITHCLAAIWQYVNETEPSAESDRWTEVNGRKFLFHPTQRWTRDDVKEFVLAAFGLVSED